MKRLFTTCIVLTCVTLGCAQGVQGNVMLRGNAQLVLTGHSVDLTWNTSPGATSYKVYRGTTHRGPYIGIGSGVVGTTYTDAKMTHNQTFYYVITAVNGNNESGYSNEVTAVIP